jgi:hypothetical protein
VSEGASANPALRLSSTVSRAARREQSVLVSRHALVYNGAKSKDSLPGRRSVAGQWAVRWGVGAVGIAPANIGCSRRGPPGEIVRKGKP